MRRYLSNWRKRFGYWKGGYWISPDGDIIGVQDHFKYILDNKKKFGFSEEDLKGVSWVTKGEDREKYLIKAMQRGWIRVREHGQGQQTFEFWIMNEWTMARIQMFLKQINAYGEESLLMSELSKKEVGYLTVDQLNQQAFASRKLQVRFAFNLSRVFKYFKDKDFGVVSAFKGNLSDAENEYRSNKLKEYARKLGYGFREIYGVWKSADGATTIEFPLFIPNLTKEDALKMGRDLYLPIAERLPQDAVIVAEGDRIELIDCSSGAVLDVFDKIEFGWKQSWESWSQMKAPKEKDKGTGREWRYYSSVIWDMAEPPEKVDSYFASLSHQSFKNEKSTSEYDHDWVRASGKEN